VCHLVAVKLELDVTEVCVQRDGLRVREGSRAEQSRRGHRVGRVF
jgi:hypothetical protein